MSLHIAFQSVPFFTLQSNVMATDPWSWTSWDPEPSNEYVLMSGLRRRIKRPPCGLLLGSLSDHDSLSGCSEELNFYVEIYWTFQLLCNWRTSNILVLFFYSNQGDQSAKTYTHASCIHISYIAYCLGAASESNVDVPRVTSTKSTDTCLSMCNWGGQFDVRVHMSFCCPHGCLFKEPFSQSRWDKEGICLQEQTQREERERDGGGREGGRYRRWESQKIRRYTGKKSV